MHILKILVDFYALVKIRLLKKWVKIYLFKTIFSVTVALRQDASCSLLHQTAYATPPLLLPVLHKGHTIFSICFEYLRWT